MTITATIDLTQPVETDETPPFGARVLADDCGGLFPVAVLVVGRRVFQYSRKGVPGPDAPTLRNVPAKPVRHEGWAAIYRVAGELSVAKEIFRDQVSSREARPSAEAHCHIVWNRDGSPVSGADAGPEYWMNRFTEMTADRDHWKAKAEGLEAELDAAKRDANTAWKAAEDIQIARRAVIEKMRPVVDVAVALEAHFSANNRHFEALHATVRAYQNSQPATSESHGGPECPGLEIEPGVWSGCDGKAGDCPTCGR